MANRKRNIQMKFYVTEDEKRLIDEKMSQLPTRRYGAYLRKMAIDGYIIYTDTADIKAFTKELSAIGRNINQIAKRINAGGPAYQADMDEIRERLDEIWQLQRRILGRMGLQQRWLAEEPRLAAAGTADHQSVFVSGILRLLWTARHCDPLRLRHRDVLEKVLVHVGSDICRRTPAGRTILNPVTVLLSVLAF